MAAFATLLFSIGFVTALAGTPAGYSEYIIPFDEDVFAYVTDPVTAGAIGANDTTFSLISVTAWSDTVTIYYDHWENGYNYDPNNPDVTADEKYVANKSQTLNFQSMAIPRPRTLADGNTYRGNVASGTSPTADCAAQPTPIAPLIHNTLDYCYDGRDRIISIGGATTVTRGGYLNTAGLGKLAAIGEEVYPLAPQLVKYILPFGDDPARPDYERVAALIQATEDNTTIQVDFNGDGVYDSFNTENGYRTPRADPVDSTVLTLQRGQTYVLDTDSNGIAGVGLPRGAVILGDKTLQVEFFYGEIDSNYNTRAVSAFPRGFWGTEYYASADGGAGGTDILLYNPNATSITINWETTGGTGSFTMLANETAFFQAKTGAFLPDGSGAYLKGTAAFWGTSDIDQNGANYDWGYSLVPGYLLSDDQVVAWAPGNAPALACNAANGRGNGLYVTPAYDNTTFFIDANGDGAPDTNASIEVLRGATVVTATGSGYKANRLESLYITGSNSGTLATDLCDLTGARIYATGPFSMSYGENPNKASAGGGLDLGYTVLPSPSNWMDLALTVDKATNPVLVSTVAGATEVTYTLVVDSHLFNIDAVSVVDTLPADWEYKPGSTTITLPNLTQLTNDPAGTPGPTLTWGSGILGSLLPNQRITITFIARTTAAFPAGAVTQNNVRAVGTRIVGGVTQTFNTTDFVLNAFTDSSVGMAMTKASSVAAGTPVSPGDTLTYTVNVSNPPPATTTLTGVTLFDALPPGVSYVPGSGSVTCELAPYVRDEFNTNNSFTGNDGSVNWATNWDEVNDDDVANAGDIQIANNRVEWRDTTDGGEYIMRSATVTGATNLYVQYTWDNGTVEAGEGVAVEWSLTGAGGWTTLRTLDGATPDGTFADTIPWTPANTTVFLRFLAVGNYDFGDEAFIDNVQISGVTAALQNVRDEFAAVAYNNQGPNNTANWATNWTETDVHGTVAGPTAGFALVNGAALQLRDQTSQVLDNFTTNVYTRQDGTALWTSNWTETGDDGAPTTGVITTDTVAADRLNFGPGTTGRSISRTAAVSGGSVTLAFTLSDNGADANEGVIVEYDLGAGFLEVGRITNGTIVTGAPNPLTFSTAGATQITLRFTSFDTGNGTFEASDNTGVDAVSITYNDAIGTSAQRTVDLTGAISPSLSFTTAVANLEASDTVVVEASASAAGPFTTLATYAAGTPSLGGPYDLTPYISATTTIRYRITGGYQVNNETFSIDNVNIAWSAPTPPSVFASTAPPGLLANTRGCVIRPGQSLTATFNVTVDNPFPINQTEILNTASSAVNELPVPLTATALNIVLVPGGLGGTVGDRVWLDTNANGVFDVGETGIGGVEVTLKDQFGTPLQVTTTDTQGRYTFLDVPAGSGYFVEITGGLPAGLTQTTDTFRDSFDTNGVFTGNNGTLDWLTNWTETGDNANPASGDIQISGNRIEFRDTVGTVAANESIQRSARADGATSIEVQYDWAGTGLGSGEDRILVQYSTDGVSWTTLRTIDNAAPQTFTDTVAWIPTNSTFFLRYTNQDLLETNNLAAIDNVQVRVTRNQRTADFSLAAAQQYIQADLGFRASPGTAALGDTVWVDANNDQTRNPGEVGLAGITVQLFQDTNGDGVPDGAAIATAVTDPGGAYLFTGLAANGANDYVVTVLAQAPLTGYTATTNVLFYFPNLASGAVRVDADFGFQNPGGTSSITDGVWIDNGAGGGIAGNGLIDGAEPGIAGVTVSLLDSTGSTIASTTTASNGTFQFTGVPEGANYTWRITDDAGVLNNYFGTTAPALSGSFQMTGSLSAPLDYTSPSDLRHFGYNQTRTIGDTVFNDNGAGGGTSGNGIQDGAETGIAGVTVLLYRNTDGDALFEPGGDDGAVYATQVTDAFGHYQFSGLPVTGVPGATEWWVSIDDTQSALSLLTLTTADNSAPVAGHQRRVTPALAGGSNRLDIDYGYRAATPFSISGRLFNDVNRSGTDNSETGLENVTLELVNSSGVVIATTSTDASGAYTFIGQAAATYTVRVTDLNGVLAGAETTFEKTEGTLAASYNGQETVTLGPTVSDVNFGFYRGNALVTRVVISSVVARDVQGALVLEWTTASEIGTVGFYLKRWDDRKNRYVSVNERLIPSLIGSTQGGTYRFVDHEASPGEAYRYLIVEVEASGRRLGYGPYDVDARLTVVKAAGDEEDDVAGDERRDDDVLLEKGVWKAPHRGNLAKRLERRNASREEHRRAIGRRRSTAAAKIGVSENAFYFVTLQELQTLAGMPASAAWGRTYSLTNRGEPVALAPSAEGDGFWFYGRATESNVEKDNVYRLSEKPGGARIGSRRNPRGEAPSGAEVFPKTLHVERDAIAVNNVLKDPNGDFYVWDYVFAGFGARPFTFRADGAAGTDRAAITVRLKGGSDTETNPDHHATFSLNGTIIGEAAWDGLGDLVTTVDFDGSLLVDGENTLVIDGLTDTGAAYSLFYVDSFDVSYTSRYRAHGNRAEVPAAGNPSVLISGFTRPDITLFDITNPNHPVFVQAPVVQVADGTYGVVAASRDLQAVYYALAPDGLVPVSRVVPDKPSSLRSSDHEAQYVVITTEALKDTAQTLADYRSDLSSMVVDVEDIYDEFNSGNPSPYAVRAFLTWARTKWRTPPRYVVLAGEGTYDYKDVEGFGDNLIPTMMANTPEGLFPADAWFVERAGTAGEEIAIGRLPVATTAELSEVIRKIAVRETALALDEPWLRNTLLVADNTDEGGDFVQSSETVAGLIPAGSPLLRAYISTGGNAQTRAALLADINGGAGLVNYFGHAGFDYLADEQLLKTGDVPALLNRDRPSMMFAFTCLAGNSSLPGYSTLGEELLRQEGGGFAALFAPSGMSANELATPLAAGLHAALLAEGPPRIGDAVVAARKAYKRENLPLYMLSIYNLLGDPAMRVR